MTTTAPDISDLPALVAMLERQAHLYGALLDLAEHQRALIDAGHAEDLLTLLAKRQTLINEITNISGELEPYRSHWDAFWALVPANQKPHISQLIKTAQDTNAQIAERDDVDRRALAKAKEAVGSQIKQAASSGAAMRAYGGRKINNPNRFTNQQG